MEKSSKNDGNEADESTPVEATEVDALAESLDNTHLGGSSISGEIPAPKTSRSAALQLDVSTDKSTPSSSAGRASSSSVNKISGQVSVNQPVMKKQLPYHNLEFAKRPEKTIHKSNLGIPTEVEANYFKINCGTLPIIHQYDMQFVKFARNRQLPMTKRDETLLVFWQGVMQNPGLFPASHTMVYNGVNILYTTEALRDDGGTWKLLVQIDKAKFGMTIKYAKSMRLKSTPETVVQEADLISILDQVFCARIRDQTNPMCKDFVQVGHSTFFIPDQNLPFDQRLKIALGQGLEVWTGLHGAVKPRCQMGMLLNVDLGHSIFYRKDQMLVEYLVELIDCCSFEETSYKALLKAGDDTALNIAGRKALERSLKGLTLTYYRPDGNGVKDFKFSGIANKSASVHMLTNRDGSQISIPQYYLEAYRYKLKFPHLPCIQLNKSKRTFVPMELVHTIKDAVKLKGRIPDIALRKMVQKTAFAPEQRKQIIQQLAVSDGLHPNQPVFLAEQDNHMRSFGVSVDRKFVTCRATILPEPTLVYGKNGNGEDVVVKLNHEGIWDLNMPPKEKTLKKAHIDGKVAVVPLLVFMHKVTANMSPLRTLMEVLHHFGIFLPLEGRCWNTYRIPEVLKWDEVTHDFGIFKDAVAKQHPGALPLIIVVFACKCKTRQQTDQGYFSEYAMLKYICDVQLGVHMQGVLEKTWGQCHGNPLTCSTAHNVGIKILAKIGVQHYKLQRNGHHKNWTRFTDPDEPTLVLGIDVTHPGIQDRARGGHAALSVACVVGNIDLDCSKFETSMRVQFIGEERTFSLESEFKERISGFVQKTGRKPSHVVIYRDGVSESQFKEILFEEKQAFENVCQELDPTFKPTLTYIVLTKRHHTRFFPKNDEDTHGNAKNLKPGTLVENDVTSTEFFDFFLLSQHGPLGTSRPGHYYVLWDDWHPSHAFWQTITLCLAYNYVRCIKSISQPAPVMYAHLAAKRAKDYVMAHFETHAAELRRMSAYEQVMHIKRHGIKKPGLDGMVFL